MKTTTRLPLSIGIGLCSLPTLVLVLFIYEFRGILWQFIDKNIAWIMGGGVLFIGIMLILLWNAFFDMVLLKK